MPEFTRDELYKLVWTKPVTQLAEEFGVSDVAIHKACRKRRIPTPGLGYWAKVQAGQTPPKDPLPGYDGPYRGWISFRSHGVRRLPAPARATLNTLKAEQSIYTLPAPDAPLHAAALRLQQRLTHICLGQAGLPYNRSYNGTATASCP